MGLCWLSATRNRDPHSVFLVMWVVGGIQEQRGRQDSQVNLDAYKPDPVEAGMELCTLEGRSESKEPLVS